MGYAIEAREQTEQPTAACRATLVLGENVGVWLAEAYAEAARYLAETGVPIAGPPYGRYTFREGEMDVEAGFPVAHAVVRSGRVGPSTLPGGPVAVTTHRGQYEDLERAYKAVGRWLAERGYVQSGPHWELYHDNPAKQPDSSTWRTEVVVPYRRTP
jgi:effector-binding domain-containing protein